MTTETDVPEGEQGPARVVSMKAAKRIADLMLVQTGKPIPYSGVLTMAGMINEEIRATHPAPEGGLDEAIEVVRAMPIAADSHDEANGMRAMAHAILAALTETRRSEK
jgi:hypothetical protein